MEGQPLKEGPISFFPQLDTKGPTAGASIVDGKFTINAKKGPLPGKFHVQITATRLTGRKIPAPPPGCGYTCEIEQYLPARYNTKSELEAEVTEDGPNRFEFDLSSK